MKVVYKAIYLHFRDVSDADNDNGVSSNRHNVVDLTYRKKDCNDEANTIAVGQSGIISVLSKKRKKSNRKSTAPVSLTKQGTCYRVINACVVDENRPNVVNIGSNPTMALWIATNFFTKQSMTFCSHNRMELKNAISAYVF